MDPVFQSVNELRRRHQERKSQAKQVYRTILTDVLRHIRTRDNQHRCNTIYRIPVMVYGNPSYDITKATYHIMKQLTKAGYIVFPHEHNHIYIDWSVLRDVKPKNVRFNIASIESK
jgi:hypothetical protein